MSESTFPIEGGVVRENKALEILVYDLRWTFWFVFAVILYRMAMKTFEARVSFHTKVMLGLVSFTPRPESQYIPSETIVANAKVEPILWPSARPQ